MFLALRELRHARLRYLLLGAIIAMIAWLVFLLSGLANGLSTDNAGAIMRMPAEYFVFQSDSRTQLSRSLLPGATVETVRAVPGVAEAAPIGQQMLSVRRGSGGVQLDVAILATEPGSFIVPPLVAGRSLDAATPNGVLVDKKLAGGEIAIGDTLTVQPTGETLTVIGLTEGRTFSHAPVIFTGLDFWRQVRFAAPGSAGGKVDPISTVAVRADEVTAERLAALPDLDVASRDETIKELPGYSEESSSLLMIQGFLFVIAALILAVFFYVITLQKTAQFGILKAIGARTTFLARDLLGQVALLSVVGIAAGGLLTYAVTLIVPSSLPFALDPRLVATYALTLLAVALLGATLSLRRIAAIDPLIAIGRND